MKQLLLVLCLFTTFLARAQGADPFIQRLAGLSAEGKLQEALSLCDSLIIAYPQNLDYPIYRVRVLGWLGQKQAAWMALDSLLKIQPENREILQLEIDFHFRDSNYQKVLVLSEAYNRGGYSPEVSYRAAQAALLLGDYGKADSISAFIQKNSPDFPGIRVFRRDLESKVYRHQFRTHYTYDAFSSPFEPWQNLSVEAGIQHKKTRYTLRVNGADRFRMQAAQIELETFTEWKKGWSGFFQAGVANKELYPDYKGAFEIYKVLGPRLEVSAGYTYMAFAANSAHIYTLQAGSYPGNWWLSLRAYAVPEGKQLNPSAVVYARRYFRTTDEFAGLIAGYGAFIPQQLTTDELNRLDAWRAGFQGQWRVAPRLYITGLFTYSMEDYVQVQNVNRYTMQGGFFYRFRL